MGNKEKEFTRAIRADLQLDALRMIYADWLERRGDQRGKYLRLQCELKRKWSYSNPCRKLFAQIRSLRREIDPEWVKLMHRCTTPAPPVDVGKALPELKNKSKKSVLLHPRPGTSGADASKIGGLFLWPADEQWPTCSDHDCPYVPALQLRKEEVPEVGFKRGTDLFQVLWCPNDHCGHEPISSFCPAVKLFWRTREAIKNPIKNYPQSSIDEERYIAEMDYVPNPYYIPKPCLLFPERVVEYPDAFELKEETCQRIERAKDLETTLQFIKAKMRVKGWQDLPAITLEFYQCYLSTAPGTKVGGYPAWQQDAEYPLCSCGKTMELLVQFSSWEFDGGDFGRWLPIEDRDICAVEINSRSKKRLDALMDAPDWLFGDAGCMYLFICRVCKTHPIRCLRQSQ